MVHPPGVIEKYAPTAIIGEIGTGGGDEEEGDTKAVVVPKGPMLHPSMAEEEEDWNCTAWFGAIFVMIILFLKEIFSTILFLPNYTILGRGGGDRTGLTRTAVFLIVFMVIHAVGNLHVFLGPNDFCGYGFFYVRLYPFSVGNAAGLGLNANIVEEYIALCAIMHVIVALKRTYQYKSIKMLGSPWKNWNALQLIITGSILLGYMIVHLQQFRFAGTDTWFVRPPPYLINPKGVNPFSDQFMNLFWTTDKSVDYVGVRDIYKLELELFQSEFTCAVYILCTIAFMWHMIAGWNKLAGSVMGLNPKRIWLAKIIGCEAAFLIGMFYISFVVYSYFAGERLLADFYPQRIPKHELPKEIPDFTKGELSFTFPFLNAQDL